ncbi:MAG: phosphatase PAP2 family protein [Ignavibacteriaceae bacterium]
MVRYSNFGINGFKKYLPTSDNSKLFSVNPFEFDKEIAEDLGKTGRTSPGSMDQNLLPNITLLSGLAYNITANIIDPNSISKNDYKHLFLFYRSILCNHTLTELSKNLVKRERPDGSDSRRFFSGHTPATFAAASFLYLEVEDFYDSWSVTSNNNFLRTTLKAAYVGYSRIHDNKHYLSDV